MVNRMFDIIFISYDEPNSDQNFEHLKELCPGAQRVHGVQGIANAYAEALKLCSSSHFFTVDGDNWIHPQFDWQQIEQFSQKGDHVHVWRCLNPVNGLIYGNGGVKLFPKNLVQEFISPYGDFTTSVANGRYCVQQALASTTKFNTDSRSSWRAGFREAAKLSSSLIDNQDPKTLSRLEAWLSIGSDAPYGIWAILGARMGTTWAKKQSSKENISSFINNFNKLNELFNSVSHKNPHQLVLSYGDNLMSAGMNIVLFDIMQSRYLKNNIAGTI